MSRVLIDTDILINFLRGDEKTGAILRDLSQEHHALCSVITVGEILAGMRPQEKDKTYFLLKGLQVIPVTFEIAEQAGLWKFKLKMHSLELDDCLIAATCVLHADALFTQNKKHYPMKEIKFYEPH